VSWWEQPYPGGPMVAIKGFPRPLYPPDAAPGHKPSVDGSDVEAYKRTISRAGRWRWQPFDQTYSNAFSHGKTGMVGESGVAGVQRQAKIQATGWVGKETFNLLRSIVIPHPLPHAGAHAMDARAVELINAAWDRFGGEEPAGGKGETSASLRLAAAIRELGYVEGANNDNKYGRWYGMNHQPYCAIFASWCDQTSGSPTDSFNQGVAYAYVPYIIADARLGYYGLSITSSPRPGDLVCYDWSRDGEYDHVGIFESGNNSSWTDIEGNTSPDNNGNQSNGGGVYRRQRSTADAAIVFVRVAEP
jgi:CHAP domain-containing protein